MSMVTKPTIIFMNMNTITKSMLISMKNLDTLTLMSTFIVTMSIPMTTAMKDILTPMVTDTIIIPA